MNNLSNSILNQTYNQLNYFAGLNNFWNLFETAFGTQYDRTVATNLRSQWLAGNFSSFPQIEILDSNILGNASGAYATSTNKIYLSANFLANATDAAISALLLEEYGHFVDAHINQTDSAGDEGDIFSNLVRGNSLDAATLQALKVENDHATITLGGQNIEIEQGVIQLTDLTTGSPAILTWADNLNRYQYENVRTIGGGYRARFKNTFLPGPTLNTPFYTAITPGPIFTVATSINELPSTEKGLLIHTAGTNHLTGNASPWTPWTVSTGFSNIPNATNFIQTIALSTTGNTRHIFAEDTYDSTVGTPINVGILRYTGFGGVKVTLDWTGPASNNLDVYLTNTLGGSPVYTPSFIGIETTVTNDNIEQIFSTTIPAGNYYIYVTKNSTVTTPFIQDFSIFATANNPVGQGHGWGDVHLSTFDGKPYEFQTTGDFILVKSLIDDFQVQTRQEASPFWIGASVNTAFAINLGGYNINYDIDLAQAQRLSIDGQSYNLLSGETLDLGIGQITRQGDQYNFTYAGPDGIISTDDDDLVTAFVYEDTINTSQYYINVDVNPADYRFGLLQGLLGNGDGITSNDFALRDGTNLQLNPGQWERNPIVHTTFADSWRVTQAESLFPITTTQTAASSRFSLNTDLQAVNTFDPQPVDTFDPKAVAAAFALVKEAGVAAGQFQVGAVIDYLRTGDPSFIKSAKQFGDFVLQDDNGRIQLGSIQGSKWNDVNGNGIWETTEQALAGWTIYIDSVTNGQLDPWELSTVTNADGKYSFTNLGSGEYPIREVNQTGWTQTSPTTPYAVNLTAGQALTGINLGNRQVNKNFTTTRERDIIDAGAGDDTVTSTFANLQQQDAIKGGAGIDTLIINEGVATNAVIINASNTANQFNIPGTTITGFERFDLSGFLGKVTYTGTTGNDSIKTGAGADVLNGGAGIDTLIGGTGNDTYVVDTTTDVITENVLDGVDTIQSSVTFSLANLPNIENLTLTGTAAINGTGNAGNNVITGNAANNILDGGLGTNTLIGGTGNDIYVVDTLTNLITENVGGGTDTIQSSITFTIATNVENLTLTGTAAINGTGNAGNNVITGNAANNILDGGAGKDILNGGLGTDTLTGGTGIDRFDYRNLANSVFNSVDVITDFNGNAGNDLFLVTTARSVFSNAGTVTTFDIIGITTNLTTVNFGANAAAQFTFGSRTFVAMNDATAGFSATTDAIVEVTGLTGTLGIGNFTTTLV